MNRVARILIGVIVILGVAALYVLNPRLPTPAGEHSALLAQPGSLDVASEAIPLTDNSRPTRSNGDFTGSRSREFDGYIWYPETQDQKPFPLVVYSHGFMSSATESLYLVEFLVSRGYVVAAINYPLSQGGAPGGPDATDVINQPADVSFLIDYLLGRNAEEQDSLYGLLDTSRIAAVGLSLGGLTTQLVAYHRNLRDQRLSAAVSIAGPSEPLDRRFFQTTNLPFMMIAGSADAIVPYEEHAAPIPSKVVGSLLVTLDKGSHTGFAGISSTLFRWFGHPDELVCPLLLDGLDGEDGSREPILAPDAEVGISATEALPCTMENFERAMRPADQQMLTRLAVYAFLEKEFAADDERRQQMARYLTQEFAAENPGVTVQ